MKNKILITLGVLGVAISTPTFAQMGSQSGQSSQTARSGQTSSQTVQQQRSTDRDHIQGMQAGSKDRADKHHSKHSSNKVAKVEESLHQERLQSTDLVGMEVKNDNDNTIGTISDLEVSQDGRIDAVYLDIGGVLGIGATTYRVPFQALQIHQDQDEPRVTMRSESIDELAQLSDDLREDMEDWRDADSETRVSDTRVPAGSAGVGATTVGTSTAGRSTTAGATSSSGSTMTSIGRETTTTGTNAERSSVANTNRPGSSSSTGATANMDRNRGVGQTGSQVGQPHNRGTGESINPAQTRNEQSYAQSGQSSSSQMNQQGQMSQNRQSQPMSTEGRQFVDSLERRLQDNREAATQARNLNVQVEQDRLILRGQVDSETARDDILEAAEEIAEDREVVDNIQINRAGRLSAR